MRICSFCEADLTELDLPDGRCPVCGGIVAWEDTPVAETLADLRESPVLDVNDLTMAAADPSTEPPLAPPSPTPPADGEPARPVPKGPAPPTGMSSVSTLTDIRATLHPRRLSPDDSRQLYQLWKSSPKTTPTARADQTLGAADSEHSRSESRLVVQSRSLQPLGETASSPADYELLEVIGEGGVGVVYAARQASINRTVAVKMLKGQGSVGDQREAFLSEAVVTGDLDHPNIVPIYDLGGNQDGALFYSMKRVQGTPWRDVIGSKPLTENLEILMKVADAVAFAHSRSVIHRDLKPDNVMLGGFGEVLVMDWGIALSSSLSIHGDDTEWSSQLGGTPAYMAPEMATGPIERIGPPSDVYLLGGILFEILTGKTPHQGASAIDCLHAAARNEIPPTDQSGELYDVARRALMTNPMDRFDSVQEFQAAVRCCQSHSESIAMSARAEQHLLLASRSGEYEDYSRAVFGFQEAIEHWSGNRAALDGLSQARRKYAHRALDNSDFDLGLSLLDESDLGHEELGRSLRAAKRERDARQRRLTRMRRVAQLLVLIVMAVVTAAFAFNYKLRRDAENARNDALVARRDALEQAAEAQRQRDRADEKAVALEEREKQLRVERNNALAAKSEAEGARDAAEAARSDAEKARQREESRGYLAQIGLAAERIEDNAFRDAIDILSTYDGPEHAFRRNWEWGRLDYLCRLDKLSIDTHERVESIALSPDQTILAIGHTDGVVHLRRTGQSSSLLRTFRSSNPVYAIAFSPDSRYLAIGDGAVIRIWDLSAEDDSGAPRAALTGHSDIVLDMTFSISGNMLLSASRDRTTRVWRRKGECEFESTALGGHQAAVWSVDISDDERTVVTASEDRKVNVWDLATRTKRVFRGHQWPVYTIAIAPDGGRVVSGDGSGVLLVWEPDRLTDDVADLQLRLNDASSESIANEDAVERALRGHADVVHCVAFSANGNRVISGSHDNTVRVWDLSLPKGEDACVRILRGHGGWVRDCLFTGDGRFAWSGGYDQQIKYWDIAGYAEYQTIVNHNDAILHAAYSPDGSKVITAGNDHVAWVWQLPEGTGRKLDEGHDYLVLNAVYFPDGKQLLTAAFDNSVLKWDCQGGGQIPFSSTRRLVGVGRNGVLALSHDARWILTASDGSDALVWDAETGQLLHTLGGHLDEVTAVAFAPNDTEVVTADARGRSLLWRYDATADTWSSVAELVGHRRGMRINAAAFLPDGTRVLTASADHSVAQWNASTGDEITSLVLRHPDAVMDLALSANGEFALTVCADGRARCWDLDRAESREMKVGVDESTAKPPDAVSISPDGKDAIVVWGDARCLIRYRWAHGISLEAEPVRQVFRQPLGAVSSLTFTPNGTALLTAGGDCARIWEFTDDHLQETGSFSPHGVIAAAEFSADNRFVATAGWDGAVKIWDVGSTTPNVILRIENAHGGHPIRSLALSPVVAPSHGILLVTGGDDNCARLWRVDVDQRKSTAIATYRGHAGIVRSVAFSPDGEWIITASDDRTGRIWHRASGPNQQPIVLEGHTRAVLATAFAPNPARGLVVTGSADNTAMVWQYDAASRTADRLAVLSGGHTASVTSVAFSLDGNRVLTGSQDGLAILWLSATGQQVLSLKHHRREITSVAFSPNGRSVLTAADDGEATIWPASVWTLAQRPVSEE